MLGFRSTVLFALVVIFLWPRRFEPLGRCGGLRERSITSHKIDSGSEDDGNGDQPQKSVAKRDEKTGTVKRAATVVKAAATVVKRPEKKGKVERVKSKEDDSISAHRCADRRT